MRKLATPSEIKNREQLHVCHYLIIPAPKNTRKYCLNRVRDEIRNAWKTPQKARP